jgi:YlmC/YmxH family sporulation protein
VINICDCRRLGYVGDVEFDPETGCITHLIVPGPGCLCGIFGREKEYVISFRDVRQIGSDIILVEIRRLKDVEKACSGV